MARSTPRSPTPRSRRAPRPTEPRSPSTRCGWRRTRSSASRSPIPRSRSAPPPAPAEATNADQNQGYTPDPSALLPALRIGGYVDVGWARATGNGSSFKPGDTLLPADYGVDAFAPAVNSRGDVASSSASGLF